MAYALQLHRRAGADETHITSHSVIQPNGETHRVITKKGDGTPVSSNLRSVDRHGSKTTHHDHIEQTTKIEKHDAQGRLLKTTMQYNGSGFRSRVKYNPENGVVTKQSHAFRDHHGVWTKAYTKHDPLTGEKKRVGFKVAKNPPKEYDHTPQREKEIHDMAANWGDSQ